MEKVKIISGIVDEVGVLHPLLKRVFSKMPNINQQEYTHGPNEFGADFVLEKIDDLLGDVKYIGIVVKTTKISQDISDIERQIDECITIQRNFNQGKKKIYINEVWVVTTQSISNNAKEKIHVKFRNTGITFIDGEKLASLIDRFIPDYWNNLPEEISDYFRRLSTTIESLENRAKIHPSISPSFYVDLDLTKVEYDYAKKNSKKTKISDPFREVLSKKIACITAEMGGGKSKLMRQLVRRLIDPVQYASSKIIPVIYTGAEIAELNICNCTQLILRKTGLDSSYANNPHRFKIFIDAVDEADDKNGCIAKIAKDAENYANISIIITARKCGIIDDEISTMASTENYEIKPLTIQKIGIFIEEICQKSSIPNKLKQEFQRSHLFRQLPQNPISAILLSTLLETNRTELPSNMTELYAQSVELMLGRWDVAKDLSTMKEYEIADRFCCDLAEYMIDNQISIISSVEALHDFNRYIKERNIKIENPDLLFCKVTERSGILYQDAEAEVIGFRHKSFSEFLYARKKYQARSMQISPELLDQRWASICYFYVGMHKDCPEILEELLTAELEQESLKWMRLLHGGSVMLAAFMSPYKDVAKYLERIIYDAADLYILVIENKSKTQFSKFSELHFTWIMQAIIRSNYSYEYFSNAIEDVGISVAENSEISDQKKALALFYLSLIGIDLGNTQICDLLTEKHLGALAPAAIFGLRYELNATEEDRKILLKKQIGRVTKVLKSSYRFNKDALSKLSKLPISQLISK